MRVVLIKNGEEIAHFIDDLPLMYYVAGLSKGEDRFNSILTLEDLLDPNDNEYSNNPVELFETLAEVIGTHKKDDKYKWVIEDL
jgi:hypothetical protein